MNHTEMIHLIGQCTYKPGWAIYFGVDDRPYIQISVDLRADASIDSTDHTKRDAWSSGKRYLSPFMCRQEVVGAVFALIKDAEMHELHEWFRYRGASIYNPHLDPDVLAEVASKAASFNVRENAMNMVELDLKGMV